MNEPDLPTPVLEIGGTHVTAALVRHTAGAWQAVTDSVVRGDLDAHAPAGALLDALAAAADSLGSSHNGRWGVALPGPFDYANGIARYEHVGKFEQLQDVDVRAGLAERLGPGLKDIRFLNDADAFGIGEVALGAAGHSRRAVCITLGTGVGSSFLADGVPVKTGADVPPDGSCYLLQYRGRPLEDTVSRRAIRRAYAEAAGAAGAASESVGRVGEVPDGGTPDVREIAEACRNGDAVAAAVLADAFAAVGEAAGPYLGRFGAEVLIVGGSMAGSWDIVEPAIRKGLAAAAPRLGALPLRKAERTEEAGLIGAAYWAAQVPGRQS
ncbi:MAG TPA: ROK family protein [Arthrobacter sp.]